MKKRLSGLIILLLVSLVFSTPAMAAEKYEYELNVPKVTSLAQERLELSLQDALDLSIKDNPEFELSEVGLDKADFLARKQKSQAKDMILSGYVPGMSNYDRAVFKYVATKSANLKLTIAQLTLDTTESGLLFSTENDYYQLLRSQHDLNNTRNALVRAKDQLNMTNKMYEVGMVSKGEVMGSESLVARKEAEVIGAVASHKQAMMNMAKGLYLPLNTEIVATEDFKYQAVEIDLDDAINKSLEKDVALIGAKGTYEINRVHFDIAKDYLTPNTYVYKEQDYALKESKLSYDQQLAESEEKVRRAYINLQAAEGAYLKTVESLGAAKENYRVSKLRYQEGMSTRLELEESEAAYAEALDAASSMLYNYDLLKVSFEHSLFL